MYSASLTSSFPVSKFLSITKTLKFCCGEKIKVVVDGEDEEEVMKVIEELIENKFYTEQL